MSVLRIFATLFATISVGFGVNALLRPANALEFYELALPAEDGARQVAEALLAVYGVRDIFMGAAIFAAAYFGNNKVLGWILVAGSAVAFADGAVCRVYAGTGEWSHWGYAPVFTVVGALLALG